MGQPIPIPVERCDLRPRPTSTADYGVLSGVEGNPSMTGTSSGSIAISGRSLARFNRLELFEKVWAMPLQRVAEGYKVS